MFYITECVKTVRTYVVRTKFPYSSDIQEACSMPPETTYILCIGKSNLWQHNLTREPMGLVGSQSKFSFESGKDDATNSTILQVPYQKYWKKCIFRGFSYFYNSLKQWILRNKTCVNPGFNDRLVQVIG